MTPCPGACNAWWRNLTHAQQQATEQQPRPGEPIWCRSDTGRIRTWLAELDDLAALLAYHADGHTETGGDPIRNGHNPRSPSPAADDLLELTGWMFDWEDAYRELHNNAHPDAPWLTRPRRGHLAPVITGTVAWLVFHLDGILACQPIAADFGTETGQRHRELVIKGKAGDVRHRGVVPCPHCGLRMLAWVDGYEGLICGNCGRYVTKREYDDDTRRALEQAS